jgi:hypothetical protein
MSHHQTAGQNHKIKAANKFLKNVAKVHIFGNDNNKSQLHSQRN